MTAQHTQSRSGEMHECLMDEAESNSAGNQPDGWMPSFLQPANAPSVGVCDAESRPVRLRVDAGIFHVGCQLTSDVAHRGDSPLNAFPKHFNGICLVRQNPVMPLKELSGHDDGPSPGPMKHPCGYLRGVASAVSTWSRVRLDRNSQRRAASAENRTKPAGASTRAISSNAGCDFRPP